MKILALTALSALTLYGAAHADVSISSKPTGNMECESGVCTATAQKAVLNVDDLQTMLASGDVTVKTGTLANDVVINQPLTWSSTSQLTLDAQRSVVMNKQVTVTGQGGLTITTNDTGTPKKNDGEFAILPEHGSVQFWDLSSSLIIGGSGYTLVGDIKSLAADIAANPSGLYALAKPYDASADGPYSSSPIANDFMGTLQGLGNAFSNINIEFSGYSETYLYGFFARAFAPARIQNLGLEQARISISSTDIFIGTLVADFESGTIEHCWGTATLNIAVGYGNGTYVGGLVGVNGGTILDTSSKARIQTYGITIHDVGGLVAFNSGNIVQSTADGLVSMEDNGLAFRLGGLVGTNFAAIRDSFASGVVKASHSQSGAGALGGLVGENMEAGAIAASYTTAKARHAPRVSVPVGGLIGVDDSQAGHLEDTYWDLDRGVSNPSQGAGEPRDDPGITGLTDEQLKSALPDGFDPKIWGQNAHINNGYPYLLANPPK